MRHFMRVAEGIDVGPLLHRIVRNQHHFNKHGQRKTAPGTPFAEGDDILIRYSPPKDAGMNNGYFGSEETVWYPAANDFPEVLPLIGAVVGMTAAYEVGRVIISRLKPGAKIDPHIDDVGKYVSQGDRARYHVVLQGRPGSMFYCGDLPDPEGETEEARKGSVEAVNMRCGEVYWFNAHRAHWVINDSDQDRLHLLIDVRLLGGARALDWPKQEDAA